MTPRLVLALDVPDRDAAWRLIRAIGDPLDFVKVGLELFVAEGPALVRELRAAGLEVFLDLKLHDIPNTVARAVERAAALDVRLLTLHASGGRAMLEAAARAGAQAEGLALLGVTVLTSLDTEGLGEAWGRNGVEVPEEVERLARLARPEAGLAGLVCSPREAGSLRAALGPETLLVTPGIRRTGDAAGDQHRIATPAAAARAGATHLVLGRTVTAAPDPAAAFAAVRAEIAALA